MSIVPRIPILQKHFVGEGAIGSHLENLQRKGGFKGSNQHAVSLIIAETDPRKQQAQQHTNA